MITEGIRTALGEELAKQVEEALKGKGKDGKDLDLVVGNDGSYVPADKFNTVTSGKNTAEAALKAVAEAFKGIVVEPVTLQRISKMLTIKDCNLLSM